LRSRALWIASKCALTRHAAFTNAALTGATSRQDIAGFLGLAIGAVSRGFARLQEDGLIATTGRRVEILDAAELDRIAHGHEAARCVDGRCIGRRCSSQRARPALNQVRLTSAGRDSPAR
jgi:hypothetical protein